MTIYRCPPEEAWVQFIKPVLATPAWVEDSISVDSRLNLSKRELLSLLLIAHLWRQETEATCVVGYDADGVEPNDGFVECHGDRVCIESKLVAQFDKRPLLDAITKTYDKYEKRGSAYGKGRDLVVFANRASERPGLTKISSLRDHLVARGGSPFDRVLLAYFRTSQSAEIDFGVIQAFPGKGFAHVSVATVSGIATVEVAVPFEGRPNQTQ